MLIVSNLERLMDYGFERQWGDIYTLSLGESEGVELELLVNPLHAVRKENEIFLYVSGEPENTELDSVFRFNVLFQLIKDGVVCFEDDN